MFLWQKEMDGRSQRKANATRRTKLARKLSQLDFLRKNNLVPRSGNRRKHLRFQTGSKQASDRIVSARRREIEGKSEKSTPENGFQNTRRTFTKVLGVRLKTESFSFMVADHQVQK